MPKTALQWGCSFSCYVALCVCTVLCRSVAERRAHVIPRAGARQIVVTVHENIGSTLPVDACVRERPAASSPFRPHCFPCWWLSTRLADVMQLYRALRANHSDHRIALADHALNHQPRPCPSGARAPTVLRCHRQPLERRLGLAWLGLLEGFGGK